MDLSIILDESFYIEKVNKNNGWITIALRKTGHNDDTVTIHLLTELFEDILRIV